MTRYDEFPFPGLPSISELTDASNECRHGRLPFDPGPRCSCWNIGWKPVGVTQMPGVSSFVLAVKHPDEGITRYYGPFSSAITAAKWKVAQDESGLVSYVLSVRELEELEAKPPAKQLKRKRKAA